MVVEKDPGTRELVRDEKAWDESNQRVDAASSVGRGVMQSGLICSSAVVQAQESPCCIKGIAVLTL